MAMAAKFALDGTEKGTLTNIGATTFVGTVTSVGLPVVATAVYDTGMVDDANVAASRAPLGKLVNVAIALESTLGVFDHAVVGELVVL